MVGGLTKLVAAFVRDVKGNRQQTGKKGHNNKHSNDINNVEGDQVAIAIGDQTHGQILNKWRSWIQYQCL